MPSAKLTVDEFREIWFQNSADPPSFAQPHPKAEIEDTSSDRDGTEPPETVDARDTNDDENRNSDKTVADTGSGS